MHVETKYNKKLFSLEKKTKYDYFRLPWELFYVLLVCQFEALKSTKLVGPHSAEISTRTLCGLQMTMVGARTFFLLSYMIGGTLWRASFFN